MAFNIKRPERRQEPTPATHVAEAVINKTKTRICTTPEEAERRGWTILGTIAEVTAGKTVLHKARQAPEPGGRKTSAKRKPAKGKD